MNKSQLTRFMYCTLEEESTPQAPKYTRWATVFYVAARIKKKKSL